MQCCRRRRRRRRCPCNHRRSPSRIRRPHHTPPCPPQPPGMPPLVDCNFFYGKLSSSSSPLLIVVGCCMSLPLLCATVTVPKGEYVQRGSCPAGREAVQPRREIGGCCSSPCRSPLPLSGDSPPEIWWRDKDVGGGGRPGWYYLRTTHRQCQTHLQHILQLCTPLAPLYTKIR